MSTISTDEIRQLLDKADTADQKASKYRWEAAEAIVSQLDAGINQLILAEQINRKQPLISYYASVWRRQDEILKDLPNLHNEENSFHVAIRWVQANPASPRKQKDPTVRPALNRNLQPVTDPVPAPNTNVVEHLREEAEQRRRELGLPEPTVTDPHAGPLGAAALAHVVEQHYTTIRDSLSQISELITGNLTDEFRQIFIGATEDVRDEVDMVLEQLRNPLNIAQFIDLDGG